MLPPTAEPSPASQQKEPDTEKRPSLNGDRKKWEAAELPVVAVAQQTLGETCATMTGELSLDRTLKLSCSMHQKKKVVFFFEAIC